MNAEFVPVALKAAHVNAPPAAGEGRLYAGIGRSKPAPQGICAVDSSGRVLAWALMFDDDPSVLGFLDHVLKRYREDEKAPAAERFMRFPGQKMESIEGDGKTEVVPEKHPEGERCPGTPGFAEGTLVGRVVGRALRDGKPDAETRRQENYVEDRFEIPKDSLDALAKAAAGEGRFRLPERLERALVGNAYLGMLDVNPLGGPGGRNDRKAWEFHGRKVGDLVRFEGTSQVSGGQDKDGAATDGRRWTHEVTLTWKGTFDLKTSRLLAVAQGREKLTWGNERMFREGQSAVAQLPAGRAIDLDTEVRYGFEARPATREEIGPSTEGLPERMQALGEAVQRYARAGGDLRPVQPEMEKLQHHLEKQEFDAASKQIEKVLGLVREK